MNKWARNDKNLLFLFVLRVARGDREGLPTHVRNLTRSAVVLLEQVKNAAGVDLAKLAKRAQEAGVDLPKEFG